MYNKENVSSRTKKKQAKEECFNRNIPILNILFYIGKGFMLRKQLIVLVRIFYQIGEHKANDMISDLLQNGWLIKKQATNTKTCLYILTKYPLSQYYECSSRDTCSVKLNNRKIWNNIYRTEFIIRQVVPMMEECQTELELGNLLEFLEKTSISIFTTENQISVYQLYQNLLKNFPIKDKDSILNGLPLESPFFDDFYKVSADLYNYQTNFLRYKIEDDTSYNEDVNKKLEREKDVLTSSKEAKMYYYNLFNMVSSGFFFIGKPNHDEEIIIGTFDKCNNMYLKKIYSNCLCIFMMLQRYLGYYPKITLQVYMSDADNIISLREKEMQQGFDFGKQEYVGFNKRDTFFYNYNIPRQYWDYIQVDYIYYPLKEKYNL